MKTIQNLLSPKENQQLCYFKGGFTFKNQLLKIPILFLILFCCDTIGANAQAPLDAAVSFSGNEGYFKVMVPDTNDVNQIEMLVGSDDNAGELFSQIIAYDQLSGLPTSVSYSRSGNEITIGMGTVTLLNAYHAKVRLKNSSNNWSDWYEFIGN